MKIAIASTLAFVLASGATHAQLSGKDSQYYFTGLRSGWPTAQCESISLDVVRQLYEQRQKRIKEGTLHNLVALGEIKQSLESRLRNARLYGNALSQKIWELYT